MRILGYILMTLLVVQLMLACATVAGHDVRQPAVWVAIAAMIIGSTLVTEARRQEQ